MLTNHLSLAQQVANRYSQLPQVEAVALGGSLVTGHAAHDSDIDLYVYTQAEIPGSKRLALAQEYTPDAVMNDYWGPGNEWIDPATGIHVDVIFWMVGWIEEQLDRVLKYHLPSVGYSTAFWHTIRQSRPLFDRNGWFATLLQTAQQPYPEPLAQAIICNNYPILRDTPSAYLHQLEKAVSRGDFVSINHRTAEFLSSYFDILFAINHLPHPGEKRLLETARMRCDKLPEAMQAQITALLQAAAQGDTSIVTQVNALVDGLDALL